ncbi:MAG: Enterochelin esterase-like protein, partial [Ignavibacteriaceae bacterium]|nr:Enterochelin esterase-like protein [Ignavibacteriaceae bacterium]
VYDVLGNLVCTLVDEYKPAGKYEVKYDASNLSSGIYFYKLQSGNFVETKKMILLK